MILCQTVVMSLPFFQIKSNLEQSGGRISDAQSVKLIFSIIVTFYLTKTEKRTKKSLTQLPHYCFDYLYLFWLKNADFLQKNADIIKIKGALVLKGVFSEIEYECLLSLQISIFQHNSNKFQTEGGVKFYRSPPQNEPLKS